MRSAAMDRRRFLKALGLGAGAMALPFYSLIESSVVHGGEATPPLRLLLLHTGFGGPWDYLRPKGITSETRDVALTPDMLTFADSILEPLSGFTDKMLVLEGMATTAGLVPLDPANPRGSRSHLIGHENNSPNRYTGSVIDALDGDYTPRSASLDYALGQELGGSNAVRSIQLGIGCPAGSSYADTLSYNESGQRLPAVTAPADAFNTLFAGMTSAPPEEDPAIAERALARKKSVVAALQSDVGRLRSRLAGPERAKLDEHYNALVDIEAQLSSPKYTPISCGSPTLPAGDPPAVGFGNGDAIPENTRMHFDILRQAFACDRTRFVAAEWGEIGAGTIPWLYDVEDMHGTVAHLAGHENTGPEGVTARLQLAKLNTWYASQLAEFMTGLQAVDEGGSTLLDNTLIVWTTDFGNEVHGGLNMPCILLGGAGKKFKMGRYLNASTGPLNDTYPGNAVDTYAPMNHLLVSIMNACGMQGQTFGSTEFSGPLAGLT